MFILKFLLFLLCSKFSYSKPVVLATFPIPLYVESGNQGSFIDLTREVASRCGQSIKIMVRPAGQALLSFSNKKVHGFFPTFDVQAVKGTIVTTSYHKKIDYIFYKKTQPFKSIDDLTGMRVGLEFRNYYIKDLLMNKKINFTYSDDQVANMKKLDQGQLDAVISEELVGQKALKIAEIKNVAYDKTKPISEQPVYYAFQDNPQGRKLAEKFSHAIEEMKRDGSLDKILKASHK